MGELVAFCSGIVITVGWVFAWAGRPVGLLLIVAAGVLWWLYPRSVRVVWFQDREELRRWLEE